MMLPWLAHINCVASSDDVKVEGLAGAVVRREHDVLVGDSLTVHLHPDTTEMNRMCLVLFDVNKRILCSHRYGPHVSYASIQSPQEHQDTPKPVRFNDRRAPEVWSPTAAQANPAAYRPEMLLAHSPGEKMK
jgi:hypothetical protein